MTDYTELSYLRQLARNQKANLEAFTDYKKEVTKALEQLFYNKISKHDFENRLLILNNELDKTLKDNDN